jgi:hypothetical protein
MQFTPARGVVVMAGTGERIDHTEGRWPRPVVDATFTCAELSGAAGNRLVDSIEAVPEFGLAVLKLEAPVEPQGD